MAPTRTIELRSDTLTQPTPEMRVAMAGAEVGDDVWGEDPTILRLEAEVAQLLNKESAVFVPSGTMGNLLAICAQTRPGDEIMVDTFSHICLYEAAGAAVVAGVQLRTLDSERGVPGAEQVSDSVRTPNIHHPRSSMLCLENTHNFRGGRPATSAQLAPAVEAAQAAGMRVHLDGARLFNAAEATGESVAQLCGGADSVMLSLSKGLSAPVGGLLVSDRPTVEAARVWRKRLGGGMRQAGILAAAGLVALATMPRRLGADHLHARLLGAGVEAIPGLSLVSAVETNIVFVNVGQDSADFAARCAALGLKLGATGPSRVRMVTSRMVDRADVERAVEILAEVTRSQAIQPD